MLKNMKIFLTTILNFCLFMVLMPAYAANQDIHGSEDHPLISRYPGSVIWAYDFKEFDEYVLPIAPLEGTPYDAQLTDFLLLEGTVTKIQYRVEGRSTLEVYRNFESALKGAGSDFLFEKQGRTFQEVFRWVMAFYDKYSGMRAASSANPSFAGDESRYLAAKLDHPDGDVYVSLYVTTRGARTTIQLDVIEIAPMEIDMITIDAEYLRTELDRVGFVTLHGIYFETDAAEMTEESMPALDEIAILLEENPDLHFYVVGHTDNVGPYVYNINLSQSRAESVVNELMRGYGISADRLHPIGVGPVSPVASNTTEDGRARNRRVELVIQ